MAWSGAGNVILMLVSIVSVAILARLLTVADYGVFAAAMIFIGIMRSGLVQGGFPTAVIQRQELTTLHIRNAFTGMLVIHIFAAVLVWAGAGAIASFFDMPQLSAVLKALCLTILLNPILSLSNALLRRRKQFQQLVYIDVVSSIFAHTAISVALAWAGYGVWALVIANITWTLARTMITFAMARFSLMPAITSDMHDILKLSLGMNLVDALAVFSRHAAKFVTGRVLGADALGVFNRADRVVQFPKTLLGSYHVLFPVMAELNNDKVRLSRGYLRSIALCSLAAAPLTVLVCHAAEGLILLLLGQKWVAAIGPTAILSLTLVFGLSTSVATSVFMALGKVSQLAVRQVVFATFVIAGSVIGSQWGVGGVCVAVLIAYVVNYVLSIHLLNNILAVDWIAVARANLPALWLGLPVLIVLVLGEAFVWHSVPTALQFPIEAAVTGAVIYGACIIKPLWFLGPDGVWLLKEVRRHVPAHLRGLIPGASL